MAGEKDLKTLFTGLNPTLQPGVYVYVSLKDPLIIEQCQSIMEFKEREGVTLIINKQKAQELNLEYAYESAWITLSIHSSLEAVGLTAAVATALSKNNISCNMVAAFYHDHLFVPIDKRMSPSKF